MNQSREIYLCLGRFGDIASILPLIWARWKEGRKPILCVAEEFESILDGCSYVERLVFPGPYNDPPAALRWLKANRPKDIIRICQFYRHPFDKEQKTASYQTESWRVAGALDEFAMHPLVFDQRDRPREAKLVRDHADVSKPMILVATESVSSPYRTGRELLASIRGWSRGRHNVVDLSAVRSERIYDLLGLYEAAACLVSVDTVHLHLARASDVPVMAIVNDGFFGSVPPPSTVRTLIYGQATISDVIDGIEFAVDTRCDHSFVVHTVNTHGATERHREAAATWEGSAGAEDVIDCHGIYWGATSEQIGDDRLLPRLKCVLAEALKKSTGDQDLILFHNSDVCLTKDSMRAMRHHAMLYDCFTMRRCEPETPGIHMGRELFGFRVGWLRRMLSTIPDFYVGAPFFDLILAAWVRRHHGIKSTKWNLFLDFFPSEMPPGPAMHRAHPSSWAGPQEFTFPANVANGEAAREWCRENMPSLIL